MAQEYRYQACDASGGDRRGVVQAAGEAEAIRRLASEGLTVTDIRVVEVRGPLFSGGRTTLQDISALTRELSVLVEARIPLARGLMSVAEHEPKAELREMVREIAVAIESGSTVTAAFEKHRSVFGDVYIETLRAAERSGNLAEVANHLAEMLAKQVETRQQVVRAMTYPAIVMAVVAIAVAVIVIFVVPRFGATFASQGVEMPIVTRIIKGLGESVRAHWYVYLGVLGSAVAAGVMAWRTTPGRHAFEVVFMRTPYVGRVLMALTAGRFARVLGIGIGSGLDVIESIEMSGRSTGRPLFVIASADMAERVRRGEELGAVLRGCEQLPSFARRLISAGKDSREVTKACEIVSRHYDQEVSHLTKNISTVIEPILTVALACIVLLVALSVFLPMWQMVRLGQ